MNDHIPLTFETVDVKRKDIGTRNTFTIIKSNVSLHIQRASGGLQIEGMQVAAGNQYLGIPKVTISGIKEGDVIDRAGTLPDLYVTWQETWFDYQEIGLTDDQARGRM